MAKHVKCPGCAVPVDYDDVPSYSVKRERAGKFCPHCGFPLDEETAKKDTLEYGAGSHEAMESRATRAKDFHAASCPKMEKDETETAETPA